MTQGGRQDGPELSGGAAWLMDPGGPIERERGKCCQLPEPIDQEEEGRGGGRGGGALTVTHSDRMRETFLRVFFYWANVDRSYRCLLCCRVFVCTAFGGSFNTGALANRVLLLLIKQLIYI